MPSPLDAVTLGIYWNKLVSITEEAGATLVRTAFSRVVTETRDYSCVLCDESGDLIAQPLQSLPGFVGSLQEVVRHFLRACPPESLRPGDTLMTNDPWLNTSQLNDFALMTPIFHNGRIVAYAASTAHSPDVGGRLLSAEARDNFEEGVCYPIAKLWDEGEPNAVLFNLIRANVRVPEIVVGDLNAQRSAHLVMERLLRKFLAIEHLDDIGDIAEEVKSRAEAAMRSAISSIPTGIYESQVTLDGIENPSTIKCTVTIARDSIDMDFTGSSPANAGSLNCGLNYVRAEGMYALICICQPGTHVNAGSLRPLKVSAPAGTIVNAQRPTAVGARTLVVQYVASAINQALSQAVPDRVLAEVSAPTWPIVVSGVNQFGRRFVDMIFLNGGLGARPDSDGLILGFPAPVVSTKVEIFESENPFLVQRSQYLPDSGGPGRYRGGLGQSFDFLNTGIEPVLVLLRTERLRHPARGVVGGGPGAVGVVRLNGRKLRGKEVFLMKPGDLVELHSPGGGGHGPVGERSPSLIERDITEGLVSVRAACDSYRYEAKATRQRGKPRKPNLDGRR